MSEDRKVDICGGVDTHRDVHVAAVVDTAGRVLGSAPFTADTAGYQKLGNWLQSHGSVVPVGGGRHRQLRRRSGPPVSDQSPHPDHQPTTRPSSNRSRTGQTPTRGANPQSPRQSLCRFSSPPTDLFRMRHWGRECDQMGSDSPGGRPRRSSASTSPPSGRLHSNPSLIRSRRRASTVMRARRFSKRDLQSP